MIFLSYTKQVVTTRGQMHYHEGPNTLNFFAIAISIFMNFNSLKEALLTDPYTKHTMEQVTTTLLATSNFQVADQHLFYKSQLVIPNLPLLKGKILKEAHITPIRDKRLSQNTKKGDKKLLLATDETQH